MTRKFNFCAGPAAMPDAVLERAQAEMSDWQGRGLSVMDDWKYGDRAAVRNRIPHRRVLQRFELAEKVNSDRPPSIGPRTGHITTGCIRPGTVGGLLGADWIY